MNKQLQQIKIGEACGYALDLEAHFNGFEDYLFTVGLRLNGVLQKEKVTRQTRYGTEIRLEEIACNKKLVKGWPSFIKSRPNAIPDYLNDLNACDGLINHMQTIGFDCVLIAEGFLRCCTFIDQERDIEFKVISSRFTYSICEAFLRAIGLWEEEA